MNPALTTAHRPVRILRPWVAAGLATILAAGISHATEPSGLGIPASIRARESAARRRSTAASALYDQGRYEDALRLFLGAYDLAPLPDILFNIGLAREKMLDFEGCVRDFRRYVKEGTDSELQARARDRLAHCQSLALVAVHTTSIPTGAAIFVRSADSPLKGRFGGRTPVEVKLALGEYLLRAELPGYQSAEQRIEVDVGGTASVDFPLERMATLSVDADTPEAVVQIDGEPPTALPLRRELPAGGYHLKVSKAHYKAAERDVRLAAGELSTLVLVLPPLPVAHALSLRAERDATLYVDGQSVEATIRTVPLEQGSHHVEVRASGAQPYVGDVVIPANRDLILDVTLAHSRTRRQRWALFGLAAGTVAAAGAGAFFGLQALSDQRRFALTPALTTADQGDSHALTADVMFAGSLLLAVTTAALYWITIPGESAGIMR